MNATTASAWSNDNRDAAQWFIQARAGDMQALGDLLGYFWPDLVGLAWRKFDRIARNEADLDDLIQDTLLAAYESFPSFQNDDLGALRAWIRRIFEYRMLNAVNRSRLLGSLPEDILSDDTSASSHARAKESAEFTNRALATLDGRERTVIALIHYEQLSFTDVARLLQLTPDAIRKIHHRASEKLRFRMGGCS
jgi:RNA polymerase sigma-70 factor (ECF subfamily)